MVSPTHSTYMVSPTHRNIYIFLLFISKPITKFFLFVFNLLNVAVFFFFCWVGRKETMNQVLVYPRKRTSKLATPPLHKPGNPHLIFLFHYIHPRSFSLHFSLLGHCYSYS